MKELLKDEEVFELAKKNVIAELEKEYDEIVEEINKREIETDEAFIEYRMGIIQAQEYDEIKNSSLNWRTGKEQKRKQILRSIKAAKEMIY